MGFPFFVSSTQCHDGCGVSSLTRAWYLSLIGTARNLPEETEERLRESNNIQSVEMRVWNSAM